MSKRIDVGTMTESRRAAGSQRPRSPLAAYLACAWSLLFAAANVYWGLGGRLALPFSESDVAAGGAALAALNWIGGAGKVGLGLVALATVRSWGGAVARRPLLIVVYALGVGMALYGTLGLVLDSLRLLGVIAVPASALASLRWHVFLWDPWWLLGGVLFARAARRYQLRGRRV